MKSLPSILICLFVSILFFGCSKDDDCLFVGGKWCGDALGLVCEEYRANGEYYLTGAHVYNWKTKDGCNIIELYNPFVAGQKLAEKRVISITGNSSGSKMILEQGSIRTEYTKN